ncbi:hypothetical protein EDC94DRAFT_581646 [Helicostylum pulchrum]|uniref:PHD-type domain-containing protein n=1 Tax=Helicostylum pulchrum TaxID=562976 RepID=A0ABP9XRV2_9FUNG|nr:hypothetical protein EDC94DRAFT_581646 [Helicostylum pulchrum]
MGADEQDACNICEGDRSTTKNPIIFCDGKGCNLPVHKICYNVQEVPEDDWYCQRCENKRRKKATNIICCPVQTGAVKKTMVAGEYMHVVCALWNKKIKNEIEPYHFTKSNVDKEICSLCTLKKGLCLSCEEPNCKVRFHATCGIRNTLIPPASSVPANFSVKCADHITVRYRKKASKRKRRLRRNDSEDEEGEEDEDSEDESEDVLEEETEEEEEEEEGDDSDGERSNDKKKRPMKLSNKRGSPSIPIKRRASPQSLFPDDQSSDDDDDMGTSSARPKFIIYNKPPVKNTAPSYKERLEAKRKKSALDSRPSLSDDRKPLTITPPAITQPSIVTPKQKLPNRAHLTSGGIGSSSSGSSINVIRPSNTPPSLTKRYSSGPGTIKSIDEIQRWNGPSSSTPLLHPQPTTPNAIPTTSFFENEIARNNNAGPRKSMEWKPMTSEKEELIRIKEENRKLVEFKRAVSEVLTALNVPVPPGITPDVDHVEGYVSHLQAILRRVGPIREQERIQIQECVKGFSSNNNIQ